MPSKEELWEGLKKVVEKMNMEADLIIVEGQKDRDALKALGFKGRILVYTKLEWLDAAIRGCKTAVVLTDFDKAGKKICNEIVDYLLGHIKINKGLRREFGKLLTASGRRNIESINRLVKEFKVLYSQNEKRVNDEDERKSNKLFDR
jgi:5S rRNA maturation endonuclease (ribonuclease M5)